MYYLTTSLSAPSTLFILKRVGSGGVMGQRGGFSRWLGEGELLPCPIPCRTLAYNSVPSLQTWQAQHSRLFCGAELVVTTTTTLSPFLLVSKKHPPLGRCRACSPTAAREADGRDLGRPVFPPPRGQGKGTRADSHDQ